MSRSSQSSQLSPSLLSFDFNNRAAITNPAQWSVMIDFFIIHPEMVTRSFTGLDARQKYQQLWEQLASNLNSRGYGSKTADKWIDAFTKWKSKVKTKAQAIKLGMKKIGVGAPPPLLTPIEEKLMGIIGWTIVDGDGTPELGLDFPCTPSNSSVLATVGVASSLQTTTEQSTLPPLVPITQKIIITQSQTPDTFMPQSNPLEDHTYGTIRIDDAINQVPSEGKNRKRKNINMTNMEKKEDI